MLCPKCRITMRKMEEDPHQQILICGGCGYKVTRKRESGTSGTLDKEAALKELADVKEESTPEREVPPPPRPKPVEPPVKMKSEPPPQKTVVEYKRPVTEVEELTITPPKKERSTPSKIKRRKVKAERLTEMRQISRELAQRIND